MISPHPDGPLEVFAQPQLPLEGVEPLTAEEMLEAWIRRTETAVQAPSNDLVTAHLYLADRQGRRARAARQQRILEIRSRHAQSWGRFIHGGGETVWLLDEAADSLVAGYPLASLLCSHAACERHLAGLLSMVADDLPNAWTRWGLGKIVAEVKRRALLPTDLIIRLSEMNEVRKSSAHFKPPLHGGSLWARARAEAGEIDWDSLLALATEDAFEAYDVASGIIPRT